MRRLPIFVALILAVPSLVLAQDVVPFKLGTFEDGGNRYLGLVLDDTLVVDIGQANQALGGAQPRKMYGFWRLSSCVRSQIPGIGSGTGPSSTSSPDLRAISAACSE